MALPSAGAVFPIGLAGQLNLKEIAKTVIAMVASPMKRQ